MCIPFHFILVRMLNMWTFIHVSQETMSIWCSRAPALLVIYHSACYRSFLWFPARSPSRSFSLHTWCYLRPVNQVTRLSCLCPWEDRVLSTVRTHCSRSEEEMKRLEAALAAIPRTLHRQEIKQISSDIDVLSRPSVFHPDVWNTQGWTHLQCQVSDHLNRWRTFLEQESTKRGGGRGCLEGHRLSPGRTMFATKTKLQPSSKLNHVAFVPKLRDPKGKA